MTDKGLWVYDLETIKSCFTYTGINTDTEEVVQYVIYKSRDDSKELLEHLKSVNGLIGFNNINFDYPLIHYFFEIIGKYTTEETIALLYQRSQDVIEASNSRDWDLRNNLIPHKKFWRIPQLDLYAMWHFNNKARRTSLKALEIAMQFPNVMEMEISHTKEDVTEEEVVHILEYNLNDVLATFEFYKRSADKIDLRRNLNKKYNLECMNFSDTKIGESLMLKLYCEAAGLRYWNVKKLRTYRSSINLGDCIFDYISFKTEEFNKLLDTFKNKTIVETKGAISESVILKGFKYDYGTGGIHGCIRPGVYEENEKYCIIDIDVGSMYPSIAIENGLYPRHLGEVFCNVYRNDIVAPRLAAKASGDKTMADGFKLSANSVYG